MTVKESWKRSNLPILGLKFPKQKKMKLNLRFESKTSTIDPFPSPEGSGLLPFPSRKEWALSQNRGLPEGFGFSFGGRFVLFVGTGKPFVEGEEHRMGGLVFCLSGEKTAHSPRVGLFFDLKPLKSLYAFRGSIGSGVFRGWWLNLPGMVAQLFHFSGDSGSTTAFGAASIAIP